MLATPPMRGHWERAMSIVDWAHVILPLTALVAGVWLAFRHSSDIDRWVERLDELLRAR
jgi:hypothetical protein